MKALGCLDSDLSCITVDLDPFDMDKIPDAKPSFTFLDRINISLQELVEKSPEPERVRHNVIPPHICCDQIPSSLHKSQIRRYL